MSGVAKSQEAVRPDPQAGSPPGVIYAIPLDSGRRDAAPVLPIGSRRGNSGGGAAAVGGGSSGGGRSGGSSGSSGTNATTSGSGPGTGAASGSSGVAAGARGASATESASAAAPGAGTPRDPSSIHSENGFGSSSQVPGVSPAALQTGAGVAAAHTAGSTLPSYLLMVLIGLAAVSVGLIASRPHGGPK